TAKISENQSTNDEVKGTDAEKEVEGNDAEVKGTEEQIFESTDGQKQSAEEQIFESTDGQKQSADEQEIENTNDALDDDTPKTNSDDETIAQLLVSLGQNRLKLKEKEKGVEIKNIDEVDKPRTTSTRSVLTLKPLPKIAPGDKGKKKIEEEENDDSDSESDGITTVEKKFKQLANDEELARKLQAELQEEMEQENEKEKEEFMVASKEMYDEIQAGIEADALFAAKLQEEEREEYSIEERTIFLKETIAAQRRFKAKQRAIEIRKIQILYENHKKSIQNFVAIGSKEDERQVNMVNKQGNESSKVKIDDAVKKEYHAEEVPKKRKGRHIKMIARKKPRSLKEVDSDEEHRRCLKIIDADDTIDSEVMETKSLLAELHKVSSPDGDYLVVYRANGSFRAFNYLIEVLHIFHRQDMFHLYELVLKQCLEIILEGYELILWGDLKIMMESSSEVNDQSDFWVDQQAWKIVSWKLYEACGVYILKLEDGIVIHMLVERRYPLSKDLLQRMLDTGLEVERESTTALHLIRFIKKQLDEE
ncbi:hypothetical protein Tco_1498043, partial [Tanacetum coccineum]